MTEKIPKLLETGPDRELDREVLPDGTVVLSIRAKRPHVDTVQMVGRKELSRRVADFEKWRDTDEGMRFSDFPHTTAIYGSGVDYEVMMGDLGSRRSLEMKESPPLEMAFIRHLKHENNVVSRETMDAFKPRVEKIIEDLGITQDDEVYVIASPSGQYLDNIKVSRTQSTADAVIEVLKEKGISFKTKIDSTDDGLGSVDTALQRSLSEFEVADNALYAESVMKSKANSEALKGGKPLPYPDYASQVPTVFASHTEDVRELLGMTGMVEVSSATVARSLKGVDRVEDFFLNGEGKGEKRKVIIMLGHGQFITDITEAFFIATDKKFPIIVAGNGDYFTIKAGEDIKGEVVEEYQFKIPPKVEKS